MVEAVTHEAPVMAWGDVYREIVEGAADPLLLAVHGTVVVVSPSIEAALGWQPDDLQGTALVELCHAADRASLLALIDRAASGGTHRGVFQMHAKDDGWLWVLVTLSAAREAHEDSAVIGSLREINLRVENERELHSERKRFQALAEHASDVVMQTDVDGRIVWLSSSITAHTGWQAQELVGRFIEDIVSPMDVDAIRESRVVVDSGRASRTRVRLRTSTGTDRWFAVLAQPITDDDGVLVGRMSGWRDIQSEVEAQAHLDAARQRAETSEALLRATLDAMLDPQATFEPVFGDDGRIVDFSYTDANAAACTYLGLTREQLRSSSLLTLMPGLEASGLFAAYVACARFGVPIVLDGVEYGNEIVGGSRFYDIRGTKCDGGFSLTWRDVTDRIADSQRIGASERRYRLIAENASDVVVHLSDGGVVQWVSPSLAVTLGWQVAEWTDHNLVDFVHAADRDGVLEDLAHLRSGASANRRLRVAAMSDGYRWVDLRARPYQDDAGVHEGSVASLRDIDAQVASEIELERLARIDSLTGLVNRAQAVRRLEGVFVDNRRSGLFTGVLFVDVDRFKDVNDTFGHAAGDTVLKTLARRLTDVVRREDVVARMGGDEILVILDGVRELADAVVLGEKVRQVAGMPIPFGPGDRAIHVSVSVGATIAVPGEHADTLLARADDAMYEAKRRGRDQVVPIEPVSPS